MFCSVLWRPPLNKQWAALLRDEYITRSQGAVSAVINVPTSKLRGGFWVSFSVLAPGLSTRTRKEPVLSPSCQRPLTPDWLLPVTHGSPRALETARSKTGSEPGAFSLHFQNADKRKEHVPRPQPARRDSASEDLGPPAGSWKKASCTHRASLGPWVPAPRGASGAHRALSPRAVLDRCPCAAFLPGSGSGQRPQAPGNVTQQSVPSGPAEKAAQGSRASRPPAQSLQGVQQTAISPHPQGKLTVTLVGPKLGQPRGLSTRHRLPDTTSLEK